MSAHQEDLRKIRERAQRRQGYPELFEAQGGVCAICGKPPGERALHVDHDHETGQVRGLLCYSCNTKLGWLELRWDDIMRYIK
jgi:Recombination endonuclease VII